MKPAVNVRVDGIVPVTKLPGAYALLGGPVFRGGSVFIGATYIEGFITPEPAKPGKSVGG
jgi:hypothetical protein